MRYVDGYVLPVPRRKLAAYRRIAQRGGKVWRDHAGDDLNVKKLAPFPQRVRVKPGETVVFSWIMFKSRAHRDRVNARVMKDPRLADTMDPKSMPFHVKRMIYGGFTILVDA
jgi:uncharacterized protein YbaA (DUF1428 family)